MSHLPRGARRLGAALLAVVAAGCADAPERTAGPTGLTTPVGATAPELPGAAPLAAAPYTRTIYGLDDRNTLVVFDGDAPVTVAGRVAVTGVEGTLVGIDFRPNDANAADGDQTGALYAVSDAGGVYTIDPASGAASLRARLTVPLAAGTSFGAGFNPVADRLRLHGDGEQNLRVNVETGATIVDAPLAYAAGDANAGRNPDVVATAYTNSVAPAPAATELYAIDVAQDVLVRLDAPNDGQLRTVGRLVIDNDTRVGFDIPGTASDRTGYATFTPPRGTRSFLYRIRLDDAARTPVGPVGHDRPIVSIAIDDRPRAAGAGVRINEVESNQGTPGDWVELYNTGAAPVDLSGYVFRDNDSTHSYVIPAGTVIAARGFLVLDELAGGAGNFDFGLGAADQARLYAPGGTTLVDGYAWTAHAATTYGRCPDGTGDFATTSLVTKGSANDCAVLVRINEVESNGGTPGDWVELYNPGTAALSLAGYVFRDNDDSRGYTIPDGTTIPAGGYLVLDELTGGAGNFDFGLGAADAARLYRPGGTTLVDSYAWTAHATTTYGRCPNGSGAFATTAASTKGTANDCGGGSGGGGTPTYAAWPGDATVTAADAGGVFGGNMSGLSYEASGTSAPGTLWAVRNGPGTLFRLTWTGTLWSPDAAGGWAAGKALRYPDGTGDVDAEGVTVVGTSVYVAAERNNAANSVSRLSVLLYDASAGGTTLAATREWNLTADIPPTGANLGLEAVTWVPDAYLTARGFVDESRNAPYDPSVYPNHAGGLFLVGVEGTGTIYAYALDHASGGFTRVATVASGFPGIMELSFDRELSQLWGVCDDTCNGRTALFGVDTQAGSPTRGRLVAVARFERPTGMPNLNNEGFTTAAQAECVNGRKPAFWSDDAETGGIALRRGTVSCTAF